jgi:tetratricopeptide (TPR) repeat protein
MLSNLLFMPTIRACWYRYRRDYKAAARIYERMLERHPRRVKLYLRLSNIYLQLGQNDERAMKAYKAVLLLKFATPIREAVNMLVAQKYIRDENMDDEVIPVLEDALKTQFRLLKQYAVDEFVPARGPARSTRQNGLYIDAAFAPRLSPS